MNLTIQDLTSAIIGVPVMVITFVALLTLSRQPKTEKPENSINAEK